MKATTIAIGTLMCFCIGALLLFPVREKEDQCGFFIPVPLLVDNVTRTTDCEKKFVELSFTSTKSFPPDDFIVVYNSYFNKLGWTPSQRYSRAWCTHVENNGKSEIDVRQFVASWVSCDKNLEGIAAIRYTKPRKSADWPKNFTVYCQIRPYIYDFTSFINQMKTTNEYNKIMLGLRPYLKIDETYDYCSAINNNPDNERIQEYFYWFKKKQKADGQWRTVIPSRQMKTQK